MLSQPTHYKVPLIISLMIHVLLIAALLIDFNFNHTRAVLAQGQDKVEVIQAVAVTEHKLSNQINKARVLQQIKQQQQALAKEQQLQQQHQQEQQRAAQLQKKAAELAQQQAAEQQRLQQLKQQNEALAQQHQQEQQRLVALEQHHKQAQ